MKHAILIVLALLSISTLRAQVPQKMSFQAVVRNADNELISNATVGVQILITGESAEGSVVFSETHTSTTNSNGLFTLIVGTGSTQIGSFAAIDWAEGPYFISAEVDPNGGSEYSLSVASELLSVPYAL